MSRTGTNIVRFAVAALLGLAACLVAWWPQSAAGSGETAAVYSPVAAAPTQKTPTPSHAPTATVAPTTAAPPPAPPPASPTHKPTKKPTHKPTHKPTTLHNGGGNNNSGGNNNGGSHKPPPAKPTHSTVSTSTPYVPPTAPSTPATKPTKKATASAPTSAPTTAPPTVAPSPTEAAVPPAADESPSVDDADTYDTYLTSSEPVETKSAPVWVVPGILLVLTSMLALLGGVLGRGNRPAVARAQAPHDNASDDS